MSICAPAELGASSEPSYPKTSELLELMRSPDANERADALAMLSEVVGTAFGEAGAELGEAVRDGEEGGGGKLGAEQRLHAVVGGGVEVARRLVQN